MNHALLIGNLATSVTLRTIEGREDRNGDPMKTASFKLAVNRPGKDAGADFIWVKAWNGQARSCDQYLRKGSKVAVDGSIRTNRVEQEDGAFLEYIEVSARSVQFLDPRPETQEAQPVAASVSDDEQPPVAVSDDNIPF